jgi:hypothetical protein
MRFELSIVLGNEEMIDIHHVARALRDIAFCLNDQCYPSDEVFRNKVFSQDGSEVGFYQLVKE